MSRAPTNYGSITAPEVGFSGEPSSDFFREFNSICDDIVTNVYTINTSVKTLDDALKIIGTPKDNSGLRNKIHVTQLSTNQIATVTTKDINRLKLKVPKEDKQRRLQVEKLEGSFKDAVNKYFALQKEVANKQKANLISIEHTPEDEESEDTQKQAQLSREMGFEQDLMLERESRIKQIEADVLDVNQIMRELGSIVHAQGETVDLIENSVDHAAGNIEEGTEQLVKASRYQNMHRKKLIYLVIIALIVAAILIGVLVHELKR